MRGIRDPSKGRGGKMKRPAKNGDEQDCFYARQYLKVFQRAGIASKTKKRYRRRERKNNKIIKDEE